MHRLLPGVVIVASLLAAVACARAAPASPAAPPSQPREASAAGAPSDQKAVADFYTGKTVRIVVGFAPGAAFDLFSRLLAKQIGRYLPGNPTIIVENRPGAASVLAANTIYNVEPKDGTVIGHIESNLALLQAIGADGLQLDVTKFNWLGAASKTPSTCAIRTDLGINELPELIGGREIVVGTTGPGTNTYNPPASMNAALGTRFKLISGYSGLANVVLAFQGKEVDGFCGSLNFMERQASLFESNEAKVIAIMGATTPVHPLLKAHVVG